MSDRPNASGQAASEGTLLLVNADEAEIIRRIMFEFANGRSIWGIAMRLNDDGIPWPRNASGKWTNDAIKRILHNEKYRGVNTWNLTSQTKDRDTGLVVKRARPANEHIKAAAEHLRIVSDELWERVQARLHEMAEDQKARKQGGWNRAKNKDYPYSGLLFCGECGAPLRIGGKQGKGVYECPKHRKRQGCTNGLRIREEVATAQITQALANRLLVPETMNWLVASVFRELKEALSLAKQSISADGGAGELQAAIREVQRKINNYRRNIEETGTTMFNQDLAALQHQKQRLENQIKTARAVKNSEVTEGDLRNLVGQNVANLLDVINSDISLARLVLQRHVKKLTLFPGDADGRPIFHVLGELDLFSPPEDKDDGVLQGVLGTVNDQQLTIDRYYRFALWVDPSATETCPLHEPLCELLRAQPQLSLKPLTPTAWAERLEKLIPEGPGKPKRLGYGAVAQCFRIHREVLERRLHIVKSPNPVSIGHVYQIELRPTREPEAVIETRAAKYIAPDSSSIPTLDYWSYPGHGLG